MSSSVFVTFIDSPTQYSVPFEGSTISLKDLKAAIPLYCGLKASLYDVHIFDKQGTDYNNEDDLIPESTNLVAKKLPKHTSLSVKPKCCGVPPSSYVCNKCHQGGHWIHECPGLRDRDGRLLDFKSVKRPTGIPTAFLLEVSPGTPGAYLSKEGKYMVPLKDAEVQVKKKKEITPVTIEKLPEVKKDDEISLKFQCPLCSKLLEVPTSTACCSSLFCVNLVQQQMLNNAIPLNTAKPNEWPVVNTAFCNLPMQAAFSNQFNAIPSTWFPSNPINSPIQLNNRILTEEEFYERQRILRAERSKQQRRCPRSRSPSGSQSPRRFHRSHRDDHNHRHNRNREKSFRDRDKYKDEHDNNHKKSHKDKRHSYEIDYPSKSNKTDDTKLMQDSINTFLKFQLKRHESFCDSRITEHQNETY